MTFSRANPLGWALYEELTAAQMNALDVDHTGAIDGVNGGFYTPSSPIHINGELDVTTLGVANSTVTTLHVLGVATIDGNAVVKGNFDIGTSASPASCTVYDVTQFLNDTEVIGGAAKQFYVSCGQTTIHALGGPISLSSDGNGYVELTSTGTSNTANILIHSNDASEVRLGTLDTQLTRLRGQLYMLDDGSGNAIKLYSAAATPGNPDGVPSIVVTGGAISLDGSMFLNTGVAARGSAFRTTFQSAKKVRRSINVGMGCNVLDAASQSPAARNWDVVDHWGVPGIRQRTDTWTAGGSDADEFFIPLPPYLSAGMQIGDYGTITAIGIRISASGFAALPSAGHAWQVALRRITPATAPDYNMHTAQCQFLPADVAALHATQVVWFTLTGGQVLDTKLQAEAENHVIAIQAARFGADQGSAIFIVHDVLVEYQCTDWGY